MKTYKIKQLIWFFIQRIRRQFGGIIRWELKDAQATSSQSWEFCMLKNNLHFLRCDLGYNFGQYMKWFGNTCVSLLSLDNEDFICTDTINKPFVILQSIQTVEIFTMERECFCQFMQKEIDKLIVLAKKAGIIGQNCPCVMIPERRMNDR